MSKIRHMKESAPNSVLVTGIRVKEYNPSTLPSKLYGSGKKGLGIVLDEKREARAQANIFMTEADFLIPTTVHPQLD